MHFEFAEQRFPWRDEEEIRREKQEDMEEERSHLHALRSYNYCDCADCYADW